MQTRSTIQPVNESGSSRARLTRLAGRPWQHRASPNRSPLMPDWTIRNATKHDISSVLDLWSAADSAPSISDSPDGLTILLNADPQALLIAEVDGIVVGSLIAAWDGWRGSFYRLAVSPERRREGLATTLLAAGEKRLRERGAIRLTAIVVDEDEGAMAFYEAVGYERQAHRARFVRNAVIAAQPASRM
jgi:ribosomal protein S18 acetylase RimI-like enzyme